MQNCLKDISKIQELYLFDPHILENKVNNEFNFTNVNLQMGLELLPFYSEHKNERDYAFNTQVFSPLLSIIAEAVQASASFPQILKCLNEKSCSDRKSQLLLLSVAIKDIFKHPDEGISALKEAVEELSTGTKLTPQKKRKLHRFEKLAGFFYFKQAVNYLTTINKSAFSKTNFDFRQIADRVILLRLIQIHGEVFKLIRTYAKSTKGMPKEKLLENLRDSLSHLSEQKLEILFNELNCDLFTNIYDDLKKLQLNLQAIDTSQYPTDPAELWEYIKLDSKNSNLQSPDQYSNLEKLLELLTPNFPQKPVSVNLLPKRLVPDQDGDEAVEQYFSNWKKIYDILNRKGKALSDCKNSLIKIPGISVDQAESISQKLKSFETENEGKDSWKTKTVTSLLGYDDEQHLNFIARQNQLQKTKDKRAKLKKLFTRVAQKPCNGYGNLTDKYIDLCKKVTAIDCSIKYAEWDWNAEPTDLEKIFHQLHQTKIESKGDKDQLRIKHLQNLLAIIKKIEKLLNITTTLEFETEKTATSNFLEEKSNILAKKQPDLQDIKAKISELIIKSQQVKTQEELKKLIVNFTTLHLDIILPDSETEWLQDFFSTTRHNNTIKLKKYIATQQVKKDHRFHIPTKESEIQTILKAMPEHEILVYEFLISLFYELLKEINDYPELQSLKETAQIRNHFFHTNIFDPAPLIVAKDAKIYVNNTATVAKEVAILIINVKYLLSDCLSSIQSYA